MTDIGTFGGTFSAGYGINNAGTIVGEAYTTGNAADHAFSYSGGVMTDIGTLGGSSAQAIGINSVGTIVGESLTGSSQQVAFIYSGGIMLDLNTLLDSSGAGWDLVAASAINDNGQIIGYGDDPGGFTHAFLLNPAPEPSSCAMLVGGLGMLGAVVRRRNHR